MIVDKRVRLWHVLSTSRAKIAFVLGYPAAIYLLWSLDVGGIGLPMALPAMLGTVLSILLGFRTNSAYGRWWEARQIWGAIVNDSRSWARQVLTFFGASGEAASTGADITALQRSLVYRQMAWNWALDRSLRKQAPWADIAPFLDPEEVERLRNESNVPNALLQTQGDALRAARARSDIDGFALLNMDQMLTRLCDSMGKCERIKNTVFPTPYAYLVSLMAWLFYVLVPHGLMPHLGWMAIPATFMIGGVFISIEALSSYLQDPFENREMDTPMDALCRTIEINLRQQLGETDVPEPLKPVDGVLM